MTEPSVRWLARQRERGALPVAHGAVASGAVAGLAVYLPVASGTAEGLAKFTESALGGRATLGDAALLLAQTLTPPLVAMCAGACIMGAIHARVVGRGGGGSAGAGAAQIVWLLATGTALVAMVAPLRRALDGEGAAGPVNTLGITIAATTAVVSVAAAAMALARARATRDDEFMRSGDPEAARDRATREAREARRDR